jgi:rSAM/selenodomain-associated transferase 1
MTVRHHLVILARAPRLGRVKRRLARDVGALAAWRFQRLTTERLTRYLARDPRWRCVLAVTPEPARWPRGTPRLAQGRGGLGERMARAMAAQPPGPVVLTGSDIPGIGAAHVARAFRALAGHDAVFGPAEDGGYWLVGVRDRALLRGLFHGVRWSTEHALADTLVNLAGRRVALVDRLADIDDVAAFKRWKKGSDRFLRVTCRPGVPSGGA